MPYALDQRLKLISWLLLIEASLFAFATVIFIALIPAAQKDPTLPPLLLPIAILICALFAIGFFTAYANFKKHKSWNRALIMLLMVPSLFSFPIGTILSLLVWSQLRKPEMKAYFTGEPTIQTENSK